MATLPSILVAQTGIPRQVEAKIPQLPKLSNVLIKVAGMLPTGPDLPLPAAVMKSPTLPPLPAFFKGPATTNAVVAAGLQLSPRNPGANRGSIDYARLQLSPANPGAARGTIMYGE